MNGEGQGSPGGPFPDTYDGALFFADYSRDCIWVMSPGGNDLPNPSNRANFQSTAANPVDLQVDPDGALYYPDFDGGTIRRIAFSVNQPPVSSATGSRTNGTAPLTVDFDGSGSSDPEGGPLTYSWDLDGDGTFGDSSARATPFTRTVIEGSSNSVSAPSPQALGGSDYGWVTWSDGGVQSHNVVANAAATYTATYQPITPPQNANLALAKTVAPSGSNINWRLDVSNLGPNAAQNVVVTDTLPSRVSFVSAPGCTYNASTRTVRCELTSLAPSGTASFTITTSLTGKGNGWITNTAQVSSSTPDPSTANNTASARIRR